jgi:hexosaminidase
MRLLILSLLLCLSAQAEIPVIPRPLTVREQAVDFSLEGAAVSGAPAPLFLELLSAETGQQLKADPAGSIRFLPVGNIAISSPEGYVLKIGKTIEINAASPAGHFYGLQTLLQLLRSAPRDGNTVHFPCTLLADQPRFGWRGFMLDESRHFSGEVAVKRLIDAMARYKLNRLHWHLTDSAGWRIEIKRYPKLATTGGRGNETDRSPQAPVRYYTQEQIRGIVGYARQRHVTIIPEIDMPGHADAAIAGYPEHDGGGFEKWPHFTFNPAKPETLEFLDNILKEVATLFPDAGVIHIGGDEVHFGWREWPEFAGGEEADGAREAQGPGRGGGLVRPAYGEDCERPGLQHGRLGRDRGPRTAGGQDARLLVAARQAGGAEAGTGGWLSRGALPAAPLLPGLRAGRVPPDRSPLGRLQPAGGHLPVPRRPEAGSGG